MRIWLKNSKRLLKRYTIRLFSGAIIRCDFFVDGDRVYLNEINPVPGSMANYLFENFSEDIKKIASNLPKSRLNPKGYKYIDKIQSAKGK